MHVGGDGGADTVRCWNVAEMQNYLLPNKVFYVRNTNIIFIKWYGVVAPRVFLIILRPFRLLRLFVEVNFHRHVEILADISRPKVTLHRSCRTAICSLN